MSYFDNIKKLVGWKSPSKYSVALVSNVHVELFDKDGNLKEERWAHNVVTCGGCCHIADQLASSPGMAAIGWLAVGTSSTAAATGDTALGGEIGRMGLTSRTRALNVVTYVATFAAGSGTGTLQEAGLVNANSGGTLVARLVYGAVTKGASDSLTVTWTLTVFDDGV